MPVFSSSTRRIIVRLERSVADRLRGALASPARQPLADLAASLGLTALQELLGDYELTPVPLVSSITPTTLAELEARAARSRWTVQPSLLDYWILDVRHHARLVDLIGDLTAASWVGRAYWEPRFSDPAVNATDDWLATKQSYLDAAPTGIDARYAWTKGLDGTGVRFVDLEMAWNPRHQDLRDHWTVQGAFVSPVKYNDNYKPWSTYCGGHGTCVLGIVAGRDNAFGVVGIAPNAGPIALVSRYNKAADTAWDVVNAIAYALDPQNALLQWGDVLLLEVQTENPPDPSRSTTLARFPVEVVEHCLAAIRLAVGNGIHVIEPAGNGHTENGGIDLDTAAFEDAFDAVFKTGDGNDSSVTLDRTHPAFRDSGAIIVAAAEATTEAVSSQPTPLGHPPTWFTNFGNRVDCYAWGELVTTTGDYGGGGYTPAAAPVDADPCNRLYIDTFGGTSAAAAVIAGAALLVQQMAREQGVNGGKGLAPTLLRSALRDTMLGTPAAPRLAGTKVKQIGVMPNLKALIDTWALVTPDVYVRDSDTDTGDTPLAAVFQSPDIVVHNAQSSNPFGQPDDPVIADQVNYVYVRLWNRGGVDAPQTTATVYWSEVSSLVTGDQWNKIGTSAPVSVPAGSSVIAGAIPWNAVAGNRPAAGHGCFVVVLDQPVDRAPPLIDVVTVTDFWQQFLGYVGNNNNVAWRNFNVLDVAAGQPGIDPLGAIPWFMSGAPDSGREYDFAFDFQVPHDARVWLDVPAALTGLVNRCPFEVVSQPGTRGRVAYALATTRRIELPRVLLGPRVRYLCRLRVEAPEGFPAGDHKVVVHQYAKRIEVGRITWLIRAR